MKYFRSRFSTALEVINGYSYPQPFHLYLKQFFRSNKKFGSQDRKAIAELAYCFHRFRGAYKGNLEQQLLFSSLFAEAVNVMEWNALAQENQLPLELPDNFSDLQFSDRLGFIKQYLTIKEHPLFPETMDLGEWNNLNQIENAAFKPLVWIRNHKGSAEELRADGFSPSQKIPNAFSSDHFNGEDTDLYQIQDFASQLICTKIELQSDDMVWDCCAGAGGKSLNLITTQNFYLSDLRPSILQNAESRFRKYGKRAQEFKTVDLVASKNHPFDLPAKPFDVIIADVPCSGSGTWFRTPEHFSGFDYDLLKGYSKRQKQILKNLTTSLKPGGRIFYITCSIFKEENDEVVDYAQRELGLTCSNVYKINGLGYSSDSMFMAELRS